MNTAFGKPGIEPRWTRGDKEGVGTAYNSSSRVWFTLWRGILTETYYPTVDRPQLRDMQFLITDGSSFFHEEKRDLIGKTALKSCGIPVYRVTQKDPDNRYRIEKEIMSDPHMGVVLQHVRIVRNENYKGPLHLYVLCAPHLNVGGSDNTGNVIDVNGRKILEAEKDGYFLSLAASVPFARCSVGYVGSSDGWTDIHSNLRMTYEFDNAPSGNIALTGEIPEGTEDFVLALSFGNTLHASVTKILQSLNENFDDLKSRFESEWDRAFNGIHDLSAVSSDGGDLFRSSYAVLMTHEDKTFEGALIASLSIPWGEASFDQNRGGYHLVWPRDMYNSSTAVMACGNTDLPARTLIYLSVAQSEDGGFSQNFWITGEPYWKGMQLDETAFPVILAWRVLNQRGPMKFDPTEMVRRAAAFIVKHGPATQEERWEECAGYSPSTLASNISALICAADLIEKAGDKKSASYLRDYADFLYTHIERWTVTHEGTLVPGIRTHFVRILPVDIMNPEASEDLENAYVQLANIQPGEQSRFPAKEIVDGGFLELVRYGIFAPDDPLIVDSVKVIDRILKVETPYGVTYHRYNHDGYGQRDDGTAYSVWGRGRAWPLLTGERAHYELALGRDVKEFEKAMVGFSGDTKLLPEQVWDSEDLKQKHMELGKATGSARPLAWAHAEYLKLLRSMKDGRVYDLLPPVYSRYAGSSRKIRPIEIWKFNRMPSTVRKGEKLRIQAYSRFSLRWTVDGWVTMEDTISTEVDLGFSYVDIDTGKMNTDEIVFTFHWVDSGNWEGRNFSVKVVQQ